MIGVVMVMHVHQPRHREREDQDQRGDLADRFVPEVIFHARPTDVVMHRLVARHVADRGDERGEEEARPDRHDVEHRQREARQPQREAAEREHGVNPHLLRIGHVAGRHFALLHPQADTGMLVEFRRFAPLKDRPLSSVMTDAAFDQPSLGGKRDVFRNLVASKIVERTVHQTHRPRMLA